jgi:hypothetical protein
MAITASAALVNAPDGNWNPDPPAGHAGWNNTSGDKTWVPDDQYFRRVLLELTGDSGEYINVVNWEIYDASVIPFVDDASAIVSDGLGGGNSAGTAFVNDRTTRTVWASVGSDPGAGQPWYADTGASWISTLRATGPRTVVEFPAFLRWDEGVGPDSMDFEVEAFLPGAFGTPTATTTITISKPDIALIGNTGAVQPRSAEAPVEAQVEALEDDEEDDEDVPTGSSTKAEIKEHLLSSGYSEEDLSGMTKAELRELL